MNKDNHDAKIFVRDGTVDEPGTVGARWWNQALTDEERAVSRRSAMKTLVVGAIGVTAVGAFGYAVYEASEPDFQLERRNSLLMQQNYGWWFGAGSRPWVTSSTVPPPVTNTTIGGVYPHLVSTLASDLAPVRWLPFHVPTLLQSMTALPTMQLPESTGYSRVLSNEVSALPTPSMLWAYSVGQALASLFRGVPLQVAIVVDLDGPDSVAFAAGASEVFEPVFLLDNWPHPFGLSPAHNALTAAVHHRDNFVQSRQTRSNTAPPLFVLDRSRLSEGALGGTNDQFDNRYAARLPSGQSLHGSGIRQALYVIDGFGQLPEREDLNDILVGWVQAGIDTKALSAASFRAEYEPPGTRSGLSPKYYGGYAVNHLTFWHHYPWATPPAGTGTSGPDDGAVTAHSFVPRVTRFTRGARPPTFGTVEVAVNPDTRQVLGASFDRDGSWNRVSSGGSGSYGSSGSHRGGWWSWGGG